MFSILDHACVAAYPGALGGAGKAPGYEARPCVAFSLASFLDYLLCHRRRKMILSMGAREIAWVLSDQAFIKVLRNITLYRENSVLYIITKHTQT